MATTANTSEGRTEAEVQLPSAQPVQALRTPAGIPAGSSACAVCASVALALKGEIPGVVKSSW